ncbi:MAG: hypothetical protein WDM80_14355 [Limisphaerales bacterium]
MSLKITENSLFKKHYLIVDSGGVKFYESAAFGGAKRFPFSQIKCLLMSPDHRLSFQVGNEVFSIPTKPGNTKHQATIEALLQELRRTVAP